MNFALRGGAAIMSAHAFCGGVSSSACNGAKRVISSARLIFGAAIRSARQTAASRYFIVSLLMSRTSAALTFHQDYSDGGVVQWDNGLREGDALTRGAPSHYLSRADHRDRNQGE